MDFTPIVFLVNLVQKDVVYNRTALVLWQGLGLSRCLHVVHNT